MEFEKSRFKLLYDSDKDRQILFENYTGEAVELEEGVWELGYDKDEDSCFIQPPDDESVWCDAVCDHVTVKFDGQLYVKTADGEVLKLDDFRTRHTPKTFKLDEYGREEAKETDGFVLDQSVNGAWVLWNLTALYELYIGSAKQTPSSWYGNWWKWWKIWMEPFVGDVDAHLRKGSRTRNTPKCANMMHRFFSVPTVSTFAVLRLVSRFANPAAGGRKDLKKPEGMKAWGACLHGLVSTHSRHVPHTTWSIFVDEAVDAQPGEPLRGNGKLSLDVRFGRIDLTPLVQSRDSLACEAMIEFDYEGDYACVPIELCLQHAGKLGDDGDWLFKQLLHHASCMIEGSILADVAEDKSKALAQTAGEYLDVEAKAEARRKKRKGFIGKVADNITENTRMVIFQYYFCLRKIFWERQFLHFSFDASRVGNVSRMIGCITRCDGFLGWMPPMD